MSLKTIAQSVMSELQSLGTVKVATVHIGSSTKGFKTTPPSIFWVPKRGTGVGPTPAMSSAQQAAWEAANPGKALPRALHTRQVEVDIHIWGDAGPTSTDDYHITENLINEFLSALHHQAYGSYRFNGEDWVATGADAMYYGRRVVLHITIYIPVLETQLDAGATTIKSTEPTTISMGPLPPGNTVFTG